MHTSHTHLDLGDAGHIEQYVISGAPGRFTYDFPHYGDHRPRIGIVVVTSPCGQERTAPGIRIQRNGWDVPPQHTQFGSGRSRGIRGQLAVFDMDSTGLTATIEGHDDQQAEVHIAVLSRLGGSFRSSLQAALGKFSATCWACKRFVRLLISLLISGGFDEDVVLETILENLPEKMAEWLRDSDMLEMLGKVYDALKRFDPRAIIAERVCSGLGFCTSPTPAAEPPPAPDTPSHTYIVTVKPPWDRAQALCTALQALPGVESARFSPLVLKNAPKRAKYTMRVMARKLLQEERVRELADAAHCEILSIQRTSA